MTKVHFSWTTFNQGEYKWRRPWKIFRQTGQTPNDGSVQILHQLEVSSADYLQET